MAVTEQEIMQRAKLYIDKLANGMNPLTDEPLREEDIVNNVRISRCLFYVSGILEKVLQNPRIIEPHTRKKPFGVTREQLEKFEYSSEPLFASDIAERISALTDENTKKMSSKRIPRWLVAHGFMEERMDSSGRTQKYVTSAGRDIGIYQEERTGPRGPYRVTLYTIDAQHFIIDNLDAIFAEA